MNPFAKRLQQAQKHLATWQTRQARADATDMPGPFVTGGSGISAGRRRKLDRQLKATITRAGKIKYWREKVAWLQNKHDAYERGECDAQGRSVRPRTKPDYKLPEFAAWEDRLFIAHHVTGLVYCDRRVRAQDDYKALAFLSYGYLEFEWHVPREKVPPELVALIEQNVAKMQTMEGQVYPPGADLSYGRILGGLKNERQRQKDLEA